MDKKLTVICGDAIEELKKFPDKSVKLIVTDPPYNVAVKNRTTGKTIQNQHGIE